MLKLGEKIAPQELICTHCGDKCSDNSFYDDDKVFCCSGCKTVYTILSENGLCNYYDIESAPGLKQENIIHENRYDFLDDADLVRKLCDFNSENLSSVTFKIPSIHCSSCIWLLEKLNKLNPNIYSSKINFLRKEVYIQFNCRKISLKEIVILLTRIGYEPDLQLDSTNHEHKSDTKDKSLYLKFGVAAFCFGNIMLLSFPEYLSSAEEVDASLKNMFSILILLLSLPVFFYSSSDYFKSAYRGIKAKVLNIDVPLSLGIAVLFARSVTEILVTSDAGYMDSMTGLVFLLLLGKIFKNKTYDALNFERDYKSYFPLSVTTKKNGVEHSIPLSKLEIGNKILIRNSEIIPADAVLIKGNAKIDYSFVTGESSPIIKKLGDMIYAGGRQKGASIELVTIKDVSQSYLTRLWNSDAFSSNKNDSHISQTANKISKYFTPAILLIAFLGGLLWLSSGIEIALNVFTAVLIVACPCALAVSMPFTLGNSMRILGKNKLYVKNSAVIENMSYVDTIVFDKTGTITEADSSITDFIGDPLNNIELSILKSITRNSQHPHSVKISNGINSNLIFDVKEYCEIPGEGIRGKVLGQEIKVGSKEFINDNEFFGYESTNGSKVFVSIDGQSKGYFRINNQYRKGLKENISQMSDYDLHLLSGDHSEEKTKLEEYFGKNSSLYFNMSAQDKLNYIKDLQSQNKRVLMIGDGLNDAGALKQSDIGISVSEKINNFTPASDGILESDMFEKLVSLIVFSKDSMAIIKISFVLSILYNITGLVLALQGLLTPLFAAILMPVSSISIATFGVLAGNVAAKKRGLI